MNINREPSAEFFVESVIIERFKSIDALELRLEKGVSLLVGPNASGKSNILEAIAFLKKALIDETEHAVYDPTREYWNPEDIFYMRDATKPIKLGVSGLYYLGNYPVEGAAAATDVTLTALFVKDEAKNRVIPIRNTLTIDDLISIVIEPGEIVVNFKKKAIAGLPKKSDPVRTLLRQYSKIDEETYGVKIDLRGVTPPITPKLLSKFFIADSFLSFFLIPDCWFTKTKIKCVDEIPALIPKPEPGREVSEGNRVRLRIPVTFKIVEGVIPKELTRKWLPSPRMSIKEVLDNMAPLLGILRIGSIIRKINDSLSNIRLLKHPDMKAAKEIKKSSGLESLDERAVNLAPVLNSLIEVRGRVPERIESMLKELFPGYHVAVKHVYGGVALVAYEEDMMLPPRNIPDGLIKVLAIMTAAELGPSILLIDEIENSLQASMLKSVIDELDNLGIPVLVATHSPVVIDIVGPERTLLLSKEAGGPTRVERIKNPRELSRKLDELGLTFGEYVIYKD